ncbi:nuclear pore complex protein Nup98-Nup96-like isoform X6 [Mytilus californianus]|uniref:nuclear pore complex protein Nup98-Nup96-like isoform X6 n=1 Tax=Mytilus californianus TaxID=6549 RepID=UPI0022479C35|nr:nuclear pore complex protein Nup98-Nup96-like isoform X6 [Mytilus californianus]
MFGAKPTGFAFGNSANNFGQTAGFGGGNTTFGSAKPTGTAFGTPGGGGVFGAATPAVTPGGGLFGQQNPSSTGGGLFGATQPQNPGFGQSSAFGATPTASSSGGGLFGQQPQSAGGLFSTPATNTGFGAKPTGFGASFGASTSTPSGGIFGQTQQTPSLFGQAGTSAGFGGNVPSGTTLKFNAPSSSDTMVKNGQTTNINTRHQCITAMKEYQMKSLEELRMEDYAANRKGKQPGSGGLFGTQPTATQQQSTGFNFGMTASPFGQQQQQQQQQQPASTGSTLFGAQPQSSAGALFGQTNKPLFGTATTSTAGFGFGGSAGTGTSLFGNQNKPLFGSTQAATTQSSLFGSSGTTGFGASTGFGGGAGGFGTSTSTGGLFGTNKPAFGATPVTSTTGFGQTNLFNKPAGTGLFGATPQAPAFGTSTGSSLFGAKPVGFGTTTSAPSFSLGGTPGGLFGANTAKPAGFGFGTSTGASTFTGFGGGFNATQPSLNLGGASTMLSTRKKQMFELAANPQNSGPTPQQIQQQLLALNHSPYGDSPLFWNLKQTETKREDLLKPTNPIAQKAVLTSQFKVSPRPTARVKPKSLHNVLNGSKSQIFEGLEDEDFSFGNESFMPKKSIKKLVLRKTGTESNSPSRASSVIEDLHNEQSLNDTDPSFLQNTSHSMPIERSVSKDIPEPENNLRFQKAPSQNLDDTIAMLNEQNKGGKLSSRSADETDLDITQRDESLERRPKTPTPPHAAGIVLTRPEYYTLPSMEELAEMVNENGDCFVDGFTIGREGYGSVYFPGVVNVAGLNLDEIVHIRRKEVIVYPDDDNKPDQGDGLNRKAEITLDCVWPVDKTTRKPIQDPERLKAMNYHEKIEGITARIGGRFTDYRPETGSWVFEVKHFTKYGMDESDEDDLSELAQHQAKMQATAQLKPGQPPPAQSGMSDRAPVQSVPVTDSRQDRVVPMADDDDDIIQDITQEKIPDDILQDLEDEDMDDQPSSHKLASSMGVSARNVQVMKASFFNEDVIGDGGQKTLFSKPAAKKQGDVPSLFSSAYKSKYMSPVKLTHLPKEAELRRNDQGGLFHNRILTPEPIRPSKPTYQPPPVAEHMPLASGLNPDDFPRKIVGSRVQRPIPNFRDSLMYDKQFMIKDAGLFMGRSFRVGWGPGGMLAHCGRTVSEVQKEESNKDTSHFTILPGMGQTNIGQSEWKVHIEKLDIAGYVRAKDPTVINNHVEMLSVQLENSESTLEGDCPIFVPSSGVEGLHQCAKQVKQDLQESDNHPEKALLEQMDRVLDLCVALWGRLPDCISDEPVEGYDYQHSRREALSKWLMSTAVQRIQEDVQEAKYKGKDHLPAILAYLSGRKISEACLLAQKSGDHRLALLLAQTESHYVVRQLVEKQLIEWAELGADKYINIVRMKIYALLSGQLVWRAPVEPYTMINTCETMDWKRALALHLWFLCPSNSPIHQALLDYEAGFKGRSSCGIYCNPPLPPYSEGVLDCPIEEEDEGHMLRDTCYHVLKLYCQKSHRLNRLLNPTSSTENQLDYRLSWHLYQILQSLDYKHLSPYHRAYIHMNFASQLESIGLWHWAVFIVLHIEDKQCRESAVKDLLYRYVTLSTDKDKEDFLQEKLNIPVRWIHYAKALRAKHENKSHEEALHLLKSGHWNASHKVILKHIAPDAIINENHEYLKKYLKELSNPAHSSKISDWHYGGQVFLDYINQCEAVEKFKQALSGEEQQRPSGYDIESLVHSVTTLCAKVGNLQCSNSKERLCQSEMSKIAAVLLRTLLLLQGHSVGSSDYLPLTMLAPHISNLPMPEDYRIQELRALTRSNMMETTA